MLEHTAGVESVSEQRAGDSLRCECIAERLSREPDWVVARAAVPSHARQVEYFP